MKTQITKPEAVKLFGSQANLARALGISTAAVSQWSQGPIPKTQELRIRYELKPEAFSSPLD